MSAPRLVSAERREEDAAEASLRPQFLAEFIGQEQARANLRVFIEAAQSRGEALDHILLVGPPGPGKTTLAQIVARELGVNFRSTSGPVIAKAGDLAALLTNLEARDVLFIDEIHRLSPAIEEILYPAMEDFPLDLIVGSGPAARSVKIDLAPFTLIGATTRAGLLTNPLRDRFGIPIRLNFYSTSELELIVNRGARVLGVAITPDGANEIARRARGTPRIAGRLLRRGGDFALVGEAASVDRAVADRALAALEVDETELDAMDRRYLTTIAVNYGGGPVGVETIAAALSEPRDAIEEIIEPFLIPAGLHPAQPRGRLLTGLPSAISDLPSRAGTRLNLACSMRTGTAARERGRSRRRNQRRPPRHDGARLLRGYGFHRHRLSRELSALHGTRPDQLFAPDRRRPPRPVRGRRGGRVLAIGY
jgi:Holliday junction DNA helicase RuvB